MNRRLLPLLAATSLLFAAVAHADSHEESSKKVKHVLLISVDGMHAVDFLNCAHGAAAVNNGEPYWPLWVEMMCTMSGLARETIAGN
jgi:peptidoglycan/LPS O-acetylase OafA/YrhL